MRTLIFLFLFLSMSNECYASFEMNSNMHKAYEHIMNLEFSQAENYINSEKKNNSSNGLIIINENYIDFLKIIVGEEQEFFLESKKNKSNRLDALYKCDSESPYYLFSQAELHLQWAFARVKFKEYAQAAYELQKAYRLLQKNSKKFPEFILNQKSLAVLQILIGSVPKSYSWIIDVIGLKGSIKSGFIQLYSFLEFTENSGDFKIYKLETLFLISFLEMNMSNDDDSYEKLIEIIGDSYLTSDLMKFCVARLHSKLGQNDLCIQILESESKAYEAYPLTYLQYLHAMSKMYKLDLKDSKFLFSAFLNDFKGRNYIKSAYNKLSLIAFLEEDSIKKDIYDSLSLTKGHALIDEDKQALNDVVNESLLNKEILKSRLLYDGGYFIESKKILSLINTSNFNDSIFFIEYYYRYARVSQKTGDSSRITLNLYTKVLSLIDDDNLYYLPMSALQIGLIYEKNNSLELAKKYFYKCLEFQNFNYSNGIHQRATSGLNRIASI